MVETLASMELPLDYSIEICAILELSLASSSSVDIDIKASLAG